ncbi:MAG: hypothetical protein AAGA48_18365 [Myxococcota bacterium]
MVGVTGTPGCTYTSLQAAPDAGETGITVASNLGVLATGAVWSITSMPNQHITIRGGNNWVPVVDLQDVAISDSVGTAILQNDGFVNLTGGRSTRATPREASETDFVSRGA